jgi:hypothetical protein
VTLAELARSYNVSHSTFPDFLRSAHGFTERSPASWREGYLKMFQSKPVFIVGAGASQEVGLPTGAQLKTQIAQKLNITYEVGIDPLAPDTGDPEIAYALVEHVRSKGSGDINPYLFGAWKIRDAMPQAISIDNFIDAHSTNPGVVLCGKLAIVQAIRDAERNSKLYIDDRAGHVSKFDHQKVSNTWFAKFFQLVSENLRIDNVYEIFNNLSFIVFNYDRCIEHYLYQAVQNYFAIGEADARTVVRSLKIYHPYGPIGALPWQNPVSSCVFGGVGTHDFSTSPRI